VVGNELRVGDRLGVALGVAVGVRLGVGLEVGVGLGVGVGDVVPGEAVVPAEVVHDGCGEPLTLVPAAGAVDLAPVEPVPVADLVAAGPLVVAPVGLTVDCGVGMVTTTPPPEALNFGGAIGDRCAVGAAGPDEHPTTKASTMTTSTQSRSRPIAHTLRESLQ
jgi:hypothetical protein